MATSTSAVALKERLERARHARGGATSRASVDESGVRALPPRNASESVQLGAPGPIQGSTAASLPAPPRWTRPALVATALVAFGAAVGASALWLALPQQSAPAGPVVERGVARAPSPPPKAVAPAPAKVTLASEPPGAEVVVRGAVVGNTPMRVSRAAHEALYLLRHRGYHPQLVRVSVQSGDSVVVALRPLVEERVAPEGRSDPKPRMRAQKVLAKPRGNDVSKQ